jgi:hypothetical protein
VKRIGIALENMLTPFPRPLVHHKPDEIQIEIEIGIEIEIEPS